MMDTPLTPVREAIDAAEAGDDQGVLAARARFQAEADQMAAVQRDCPELLADTPNPWVALASVFDVLEEQGSDAAREAVWTALRAGFGTRS